jgi:acyl phosphate:glycerol-3-phosphate acyltransferase
MNNIAYAVLSAYLLGAMPFSYILGKLVKGIDIRKSGSKNVGATNLMRCAGTPLGIFALALDILKGTLAVTFLADIFYAQDFLISYHLFRVILGLVAVSGHVWTIFLKFKGGKGVATTIGVLAGLSPLAVCAGIGVWFIFILIFKYVSLSSIAMAITLPVSMFFLSEPIEYTILSSVLCIIIISRHYSNIRRIINKSEPCLNISSRQSK